jgi:hypothetical protein
VGHTFFPRQVEHSDCVKPPILPYPSHFGHRPLPLHVSHVATAIAPPSVTWNVVLLERSSLGVAWAGCTPHSPSAFGHQAP